MEEIVGTWCGWTPRAIEMTKQMKERYLDNFIAIAIHTDGINPLGTDAMAISENYQSILKKFSSTPNSLINRATNKDPNLPETENFTNDNKSNAVATIDLSVNADVEDVSKIIVKTETHFGFNDEVEGRYRITYVVLEDGVGPYVQSNIYSNQPEMSAPDDYLNVWTKQESQVEMLHDNVARGIYPDVNGVNGSVPASIKEGESYDYEYALTLPANIQNKENVRIVAMLIDSWSGEILNAATCKIRESSINITLGDANHDGSVTITDAVSIVNKILGNESAGFVFDAADVNGDGQITITDAVGVVSIILNNGAAAPAMDTPQGQESEATPK